MTKEEIIKRMEEIKSERFYLAMKDRWSPADFEADRKMLVEFLNLKKELEKK